MNKSYSNIREIVKSVKNAPRKEAVAHFRLATKHDCLAEHLHRFGFVNDNSCKICNMGKILNGDHLTECPELNKFIPDKKIHKLYWLAREKLT